MSSVIATTYYLGLTGISSNYLLVRIERGVSDVHVHIERRMGSGGMLLHEFSEIIVVDALRLLLRPFWDKSRAVVPTWPA